MGSTVKGGGQREGQGRMLRLLSALATYGLYRLSFHSLGINPIYVCVHVCMDSLKLF